MALKENEKKIYFGTTDNDIVDNYYLARLAMVAFGVKVTPSDFDKIRVIAEQCSGITGEIEHPSSRKLALNGYLTSAAKLMHDRKPELSMSACFKKCQVFAEKEKENNNEITEE